jgi:endo-1,4-beta-xylanase
MRRSSRKLHLEQSTTGRVTSAPARPARAGPAERRGVWLIPLVSIALVLATPSRGAAQGAGCGLLGSDCALRDVADAVSRWVGAAAATPGEDPEIEAVLAAEFNSLTPENALKWPELASAPGQYDFTVADALVDFAEQGGMRVRGHTLVWHRLNGIPSWLEAEVSQAPDPAARMRELLTEHIQTVVGRYAGRIESWDVVNEPLAVLGGELDPDSIFLQTLGPGYVAEVFELAHQADPQAKLFLNEVMVEGQPGKAAGLVTLVGNLVAQGVPIHGVGLQGHFFFGVPARQDLEDLIRSFADLGLLVEFTEIDVPLGLFDGAPEPLIAQAKAYADVFSACTAVQRCRGLTTWGLSDRSTWLDRVAPWDANAPNKPLLFDETLEPKPAYFAARAGMQSPFPLPVPAAGPWLLVLAIAAAAFGVLRRRFDRANAVHRERPSA